VLFALRNLRIAVDLVGEDPLRIEHHWQYNYRMGPFRGSILSGAVSVLFGLIVLIAPGAGALGLIWAIAAYSIVFGISFVALAFRLRNHRHEVAAA